GDPRSVAAGDAPAPPGGGTVADRSPACRLLEATSGASLTSQAANVPAACPMTGALAGSHGRSWSNRQDPRRSQSQSAGSTTAAPQTSQADSPTSQSNPGRTGHTRDAEHPSIKAAGVTA